MIGAKAWKTRNSVPCDQSSFLSKHLDPVIHRRQCDTWGRSKAKEYIIWCQTNSIYSKRKGKRVRFGQIQVRNIRSRSIHLKKL